MATVLQVPAVITAAGSSVTAQYNAFFQSHLKVQNTRGTYRRAAGAFFDWIAVCGVKFDEITGAELSRYLEQLRGKRADASIRLHASALRSLFAWFLDKGVIHVDPASHLRVGTPKIRALPASVPNSKDIQKLFKSIDGTSTQGLRDRALLGVMAYLFASVSTVVALNARDYDRTRRMIKLREPHGHQRQVPVNVCAARFLDQYLKRIGPHRENSPALFRTISGRKGELTLNRMTRVDVLRMIKRRGRAARLSSSGISCRSIQRAGIATYLANGGTVVAAQKIAGRSTAFSIMRYDSASRELTLRDVDRIAFTSRSATTTDN